MDRVTDSAAGEKAQASTPEPSTEAEDSRPRVTWGAGSAPKSKKEPIPKWIWAAIGVTILLLVTIVSYGLDNEQSLGVDSSADSSGSAKVDKDIYRVPRVYGWARPGRLKCFLM